MVNVYVCTKLITDLTNTLQRQNDRPFVENEDSWRMADKRFVWNHFIANNLLQFADESSKPAVSAFLVQVIHGAVFINRCSINGVRDLILKDFQHDFNAIIFFCRKVLCGPLWQDDQDTRQEQGSLHVEPMLTETLPTIARPSRLLNIKIKLQVMSRREAQCHSNG